MNFQESTTILIACTKKSGNLLKAIVHSTNVLIIINQMILSVERIHLKRQMA